MAFFVVAWHVHKSTTKINQTISNGGLTNKGSLHNQWLATNLEKTEDF
jgi:hypothetical protein